MNRKVLQKTWFVARYFNRGWYPETWEGWLVSLMYILFVFVSLVASSILENSFVFLVLFVILTAIFLFICNAKSRRPVPTRDGKEKSWKAGSL